MAAPNRPATGARLVRALAAIAFLALGAIAFSGIGSARWFDDGPDRADVIAVDRLPPEARDTLAAIRRGGPFRYDKDGSVFSNRERALPRQPRGYYTEYTVRTPGSPDRGARRIVAGGDPRSSGEYWYTDDHYRSFKRIRE